MKVFFDFDDTLFNTRDFVEEFFGIFSRLGIDRSAYDTTYREILDQGGAYDEREHFKILDEKFPSFDVAAAQNLLDNLLNDTTRFVFPDVLPTLKKLRDFGAQVFVLSFGRQHFQERKISGTGLNAYFDRVFITTGKKHAIIENVLQETFAEVSRAEPVWFFDDRAEYAEDVKRAFPFIKTVQVSRKECRYRDQPSPFADFTVESFDELRFL